jgi:uncharacterized protein YutE (UPF0331/DUF86 family)
MVDEALQAAKTAAITDAVLRIREVLPATAEEFRANRTVREVVTLNLLVAIQETLALATHWLADSGRTVPSTYGEVFLALAEMETIDRELARRLVAASGLRNLIAHQYAAIDADRLHTIASDSLDDLLELTRVLARRVRGG